MTDLARGQATSAGAATPSPLSIRPRPVAAAPDSGRAAARAVLDDALRGIELTRVDRRFVARLSQWDKRTATTLAGLIARARRAGRAEAGRAEAGRADAATTAPGKAAGDAPAGAPGQVPAPAAPRSAVAPEQIEIVLAALMDAFAYRTSGASAAGCWDCANLARGLCAEHALDADRAHAFAELTVALGGAPGSPGSPGSLAAKPAAQVTAVTSAIQATPTTLARYRRRAVVAS